MARSNGRLKLNWDHIKAMAPATLAAVVECAGNGRVYYEPAREGLQWQNGAVGNAEWTGVLLRDILAAAGLKGSAQEVLLIGADRGIVDSNKKTASPGPIAFARSLPLQKAIADSTLLAYAMNDEPLTHDHGHPLRAVVGGWFGMAWVKWITHVRVLEQPFLGYWQARDYFRWERGVRRAHAGPSDGDGGQGADRAPGEWRKPGRRPTLSDFRRPAWSGEAAVRQVQVCAGDGEGWREARISAKSTLMRGDCGKISGRLETSGDTGCGVA